jgi:hypothetical protein
MKVKIIIFLALFGVKYAQGQVAEIPFELEDDLILLKVKVNDIVNTRTFIFDTGATSDLLDTSTANTLGLEANYKQEVAGAGGTKTYDIILSQKLTLTSKVVIDETHLVLADLSKIKERLESNFDGIIGYSLLKKYITKIDYENNKILLYNKIENVDIFDYKAIPFEFGNGIPIPQFDIDITLRNGGSYSGKVLFDSGAGLTLLINTPFNKKNKLSKKAGKSLVNTLENLHGKSISESIAIKSMHISGFKLGEMTISIAHDEAGVSSYENYLGILGAEIISKFHVILDYSSSTLYLKPNKAFHKPFDFPVSGIKLKKLSGVIVVERVEKTSVAYKNGVRKGDKVIAINKDASKNLKVYKNYLKAEKSTVTISLITANGKSKNIEFKLKRLL